MSFHFKTNRIINKICTGVAVHENWNGIKILSCLNNINCREDGLIITDHTQKSL